MRNLNWIVQPLTAISLGILVLLNLAILFFWYLPGSSSLNRATDQLGNSLVRSLAFESTSAVYSENRTALSNILNRFSNEEVIIQASVTLANNSIRLNSQLISPNAPSREFRHPIEFSNELLGYAHLDISEYNLDHWHSQAKISWFFFNLMSIAGLGGLIYYRSHHHEKQWAAISTQLHYQFPDIHQKLSGSADRQLSQLLLLLNNPLNQQGKLMRYFSHDPEATDSERLLEQIELVEGAGRYGDVALVAVQCQNWAELIREYSAPELQSLWQEYESLMIRVAELYTGALLPDGFSLAFGVKEPDEYAMNSICAARVLQLALELIAQSHSKLSPIFGIALSAGPAFISKTHKHGLPLPLIAGDAEIWLSQIKALQPVNQILMAEPILQFQEVNEQIETSLIRDVTLRDGQRLEIWELDRLKEADDLLVTQARTLVQTNVMNTRENR